MRSTDGDAHIHYVVSKRFRVILTPPQKIQIKSIDKQSQRIITEREIEGEREVEREGVGEVDLQYVRGQAPGLLI